MISTKVHDISPWSLSGDVRGALSAKPDHWGAVVRRGGGGGFKKQKNTNTHKHTHTHTHQHAFDAECETSTLVYTE
jgi:hypothetical protein